MSKKNNRLSPKKDFAKSAKNAITPANKATRASLISVLALADSRLTGADRLHRF
jgi:hypothetical protein